MPITPQTFNVLSWAEQENLNLIPVIHLSKKPLLPWEKYEYSPSTWEERQRWASKRLNFGVVCGATSGGLVVADFDYPALARAVFNFEQLLNETVVVATSRGYHVYFKNLAAVSSTSIKLTRSETQ